MLELQKMAGDGGVSETSMSRRGGASAEARGITNTHSTRYIHIIVTVQYRFMCSRPSGPTDGLVPQKAARIFILT